MFLPIFSTKMYADLYKAAYDDIPKKNEVGVLGSGGHRKGGWPESREQDGGYPSLSIIVY